MLKLPTCSLMDCPPGLFFLTIDGHHDVYLKIDDLEFIDDGQGGVMATPLVYRISDGAGFWGHPEWDVSQRNAVQVVPYTVDFAPSEKLASPS